MEDKQRQHRPHPKRDEPHRGIDGMYRDGNSPKDGEREHWIEGADGKWDGTWSDAVTEAVDLAYRVCDEQMELGKRIAKQISRGSYDWNDIDDEVLESGERLFKRSAELWTLWLQFLASLAGRVERSSPSPVASTQSRDGTFPAVSIEVESQHPARVTLDLRPAAKGRTLVARPLTARPDDPALTDARFVPEDDGGMIFSLRVPPTQPHGVYTGVVVDGSTHEALGTLTVRIGR